MNICSDKRSIARAHVVGEDRAGEEESRPVEGATAHDSVHEASAKYERFETAFWGTTPSLDLLLASLTAKTPITIQIFL